MAIFVSLLRHQKRVSAHVCVCMRACIRYIRLKTLVLHLDRSCLLVFRGSRLTLIHSFALLHTILFLRLLLLLLLLSLSVHSLGTRRTLPRMYEPTRRRGRLTKQHSLQHTVCDYFTGIRYTKIIVCFGQLFFFLLAFLFFFFFFRTDQWNESSDSDGGVMAGKWSPHLGKFGGIGGRSAWVPTWSIKFIPINMWNRKWQWNNQYPGKREKIVVNYRYTSIFIQRRRRWRRIRLPGLSARNRKMT